VNLSLHFQTIALRRITSLRCALVAGNDGRRNPLSSIPHEVDEAFFQISGFVFSSPKMAPACPWLNGQDAA